MIDTLNKVFYKIICSSQHIENNLYKNALYTIQEYSIQVLNHVSEKDNFLQYTNALFLKYITDNIIQHYSDPSGNINVKYDDIVNIINATENFKSFLPDIENIFNNNDFINEAPLQYYVELIEAETYKYFITDKIDTLSELVDNIKNEKYNTSSELMKKFNDTITTLYTNIITTSSNEKHESGIILGDKNVNISDTKGIKDYKESVISQEIMSSGIDYFDKYILKGGFASTRLYLFGALPGVGKSLLLLNFLKHAACNSRALTLKDLVSRKYGLSFEKKHINENENKIFFYYTLENSETETLSRLLSSISYTETSDVESIIAMTGIIEKLSIFKSFDIYDDVVVNGDYSSVISNKDMINIILETVKNELCKDSNIKYISRAGQNIKKKLTLNDSILNGISEFTKDPLLNFSKKHIKGILDYMHYIHVIYTSYMTLLSTITGNNMIKIKFFSANETNVNNIIVDIDKTLLKYPDKKVGAIYIDYLDLLRSSQPSDMYRIELGYVTSDLKKLAKKMKCPVVTATQLNGSGYDEKGNPGLGAVTESKKKVEHTDFYANITVDNDATDTIYTSAANVVNNDKPIRFWKIYVSKNRSGSLGTFSGAVFYPQMKFYSMSDDYNPSNENNINDIKNFIRHINDYSEKIMLFWENVKKTDVEENNKVLNMDSQEPKVGFFQTNQNGR